MLTFEKKRGRGSDDSADARIYVYEHPKKDTGGVQIIVRIRRAIVEQAGWFVGDYAIPSVDETAREWVLTRTTDRRAGYKVSSTQKAGAAAAYVKVTASRDDAFRVVPGGECAGRITSLDARRISIAY